MRYRLWLVAAILALSISGGVVGGYLALWPTRPATPQAPAPPQVASVPPPVVPPPVVAPPVPAPLVIAPPAVAPPVALPPAPPPPAEFTIRTADEATIAADVPVVLTLFRFQQNPQVLVLDFPNLLQQGLMLNRVAAMVEKAGLPRDRVLTDAELNIAIKAHGDTVESYYYGHDYPAAALAAFFRSADRQGIKLDPQEELLRRLLTEQGFMLPGSRQALISLPRAGLVPGLDQTMRASILEHELSHGEFFSNPVYADFVRHFYNSVLPPADRAAFHKFLMREDYDPAVPDLILNETQAYLMNTSDPRLFNAAEVGLSDAELDMLRRRFLAGMPAGWLRDRIARKLARQPRPVAAQGEDTGMATPSASPLQTRR